MSGTRAIVSDFGRDGRLRFCTSPRGISGEEPGEVSMWRRFLEIDAENRGVLRCLCQKSRI